MDSLYSINDVAEEIEISVSTIRKYEKDYSLEIMRNESNNRVYTDKDMEIFKKIVKLKKEGASIHLIRKLLANEGIIANVPEVLEYKDLHRREALWTRTKNKRADQSRESKINELYRRKQRNGKEKLLE